MANDGWGTPPFELTFSGVTSRDRDGHVEGSGGSDPLAVLVASRSSFRRRLLSQIIETEHEEVATVQNGVEATDRVGEDSYDVIVLDRELPIKNGFEAAASVRDENDRIGIVLLVSDDREETIAEAESVGANQVLVRPFQSEALLTACRMASPA